MYTFSTKKFLVQFRHLDTDAPSVVLDSDVLDVILAAQLVRCTEADEAAQRIAHDAHVAELCEYQTRFFATFVRPVPEDAVENPIQISDLPGNPALFPDKYYFYPFHPRSADGYPVDTEPNFIRAGRVVRADNYEELVAPWLAELIRDFGKEMVFRAALKNSQTPRIDAVCKKFALPLSTVRFSKAKEQKEMFAFRLKMDGAIVPVYADRLGPTELPERLTPWSKMVLARPDAHAILSEIARVLND